MICADCGQEVQKLRPGEVGWASYKGNNSWSYVCRSEVSMDTGLPMLISADYHYAEGEQQRHFPETE